MPFYLPFSFSLSLSLSVRPFPISLILCLYFFPLSSLPLPLSVPLLSLFHSASIYISSLPPFILCLFVFLSLSFSSTSLCSSLTCRGRCRKNLKLLLRLFISFMVRSSSRTGAGQRNNKTDFISFKRFLKIEHKFK